MLSLGTLMLKTSNLHHHNHNPQSRRICIQAHRNFDLRALHQVLQTSAKRTIHRALGPDEPVRHKPRGLMIRAYAYFPWQMISLPSLSAQPQL